MAKLRRRLGGVAVLLVGLIVIGFAVLHLPSIRARVLDRVRGYAARELDVALSASSLRYNLFTRSVELSDLSVASTSAAEPFLQADRLRIVFGRGIYLGQLTINRLSLDRPRLTVVRRTDGTTNLPSSRNGAPQQSSPQLGVVSVTALSMHLDDRVARRSFTTGPFDLSVDTGASKQFGAFGPGGFTLRADRIETSGTIAGRVAFDGSRVRIDELTAETPEGRFALTGWADVTGERPAVESRINASVNLPNAARLARLDVRGLQGHLEGVIDVNGALAAPAIEVTVTSRGAGYAPLGRFELRGRSSFSGSRADIHSLSATSTAGSVDVQGGIELGDAPSTATPPSRVALRWSDLRVDDLVQAIGYSPPIRSGSVARGSATIDFDARDLAWSRLRVSAATTLQALANASSAEFLALSGRADLQVDEGRWSLRHSIEAAHARADLTGEMNGLLATGPGLRSTLGGRSRFRVSDIGAALPLMEAAGVTPPAHAQGLSGSMLATLEPAGTTDRPRARIALAARDLRAPRLPLTGTLDARLDVDANGMQAHDVQANSGTTSLRASGTYAWRGSYEGRFELNQGELSEIATQSGSPVTVGGAARVDGTISGTRGTGHAVVSLSARDLVVEQVPIGSLAARGRLTLADGGPITVEATAPSLGALARFEIINRVGYPVSGEITLEHQQVGALIPPRYRQLVGEVSGALSATARGSGRLSEPAGIRGRIDLRRLDMTARGTRLVLSAPGSVTLTEDRLVVASVDLRVAHGTRATVDGELGTAASAKPLRLHIEGPLSEMIEIGSRTAGLPLMPVRADGTVTLDLAVAGTFDHPLPGGHLGVRSSSIQYGALAPMRNLTLDAAITPTLVTLRTLAAQWQGASIGGEGTLPWRVIVSSLSSPPETAAPPSSHLARWLNALPAEPARAKLTVRADNVTQAVLKDVLGPERLQEIEGAASAAVVVEADRVALERIRATAVLERASLTLAGVPFVQSVPTQLRLDSGRASIDAFRWSAEGNVIVATGAMNLAAERPSMGFDVSGSLDLRAVGAFLSGISSGGTADVDLRVTGPADNPEITGRITVADGELQLDTPRLAASDLTGTLQLVGGRQATVSLAGLVNTGSSRLEGTLDLRDLAAPLGKLQFTARGVALEYPSGLQTESNVDLLLALDGARSMLSGRIDVLGGTYREPLFLSSQLLNLSSTSGIARAVPPADALSGIGLEVAVATASDVRIDNNYGRLDIGATLRVVGTLANPGVLGRLEAADDGVIYLGGNTYRIERLEVDLANPRALTPAVDFAAQTRVGDLPIGLELRCPAEGPCERKVVSLATNVDDKEAEARLFGAGGGGASVGEGFARLLSTELLGAVGRTVGLDTVRLEQGAERSDIFDDPTLISGDVNPATRLTLGKRLGSNVELVYSQNLADDGFTWITSYTGPHGLSGRLLVLDDQSRAYEIRHEPLGAGRTRQRPRPPGPRIAEVRILGTPGFSDKQVLGRLRLARGDRFTFGAWQRDRDRLERFYHSQGYLEARIRARRLPVDRAAASIDDTVLLEYAITRGPATRLIVRGATLPDEVRDSIVARWTSALFDGFLERDARTIVREHLYREGYLNAAVTTAVALDASSDLKTLTIEAVPGSIVPGRIEVTANAAVPTARLLEVANAGNPLAAWLSPAAVEQLLEEHYGSEGFLAADVSIGAPATVNGTSVITIHVEEATPYAIGTLTLSGLPAGQEQQARDSLALSAGERYRPARVAEGVERLAAGLRRQAYRQASVDVDTHIDRQTARVDVAIRVAPGPRSILRDVVVEGDDATKSRVAQSIVLEPGAPLDPAAIAETRRRLYDLDAYRSVDVDVQQAESAPAPAAGAPLEQPVIARITLEERARYRLRYGLAVSDEVVGPDERDRGLGFAADLENRNVFGSGATAGVSVRLRQDQRVGRFTLGAKRFFGLPIRSTLFVERERQLLDPEGAFPITVDISALSAEQAYRIRPSIDLRYGYGFEKNHTFIRSEEADAFDLTVNIARFRTSGLVDRRDDAFNPARGWFTASTVEFSTPGIGSDLKFLKDFAQYSHYVPLGRLVLAGAARLGLARTFGDEVLIPSERFYAGGGNTVRGYREDALGEQSVLGGAEGGSALLVLNGEVRFPVYRWLRGVGFVDLGNVYPRASDVSFTDLQIGIGVGARFDTPLGLIRLDLGVPANRRSIDPRWRFHIGFGQIF